MAVLTMLISYSDLSYTVEREDVSQGGFSHLWVKNKPYLISFNIFIKPQSPPITQVLG